MAPGWRSGKMLPFIIGFTLVMCLTCSSISAGSALSPKVVGYLQRGGDLSTVQYDTLTQINYAFLVPTATGELEWLSGIDEEERQALNSLVSRAHDEGVAVLISVGGWDIGDGGGVDSRFAALAEDAAMRTTFIDNLVAFINRYGMDGVDIDWEFPDSTTEADHFVALMQEVRAAMQSPDNFVDGQTKLLTAAVSPEDWYGQWVKPAISDTVDFLNVMAYEKGGVDHSPYTYAVEALDYWITTRGFPKERIMLGLPFFAKDNQATPSDYKPYAVIIDENPDLGPHIDHVDGYYFNGINTIKKKTRYAINNSGGVMIWSIEQDSSTEKSLLTAINREINRRKTRPWIPLLLFD